MGFRGRKTVETTTCQSYFFSPSAFLHWDSNTVVDVYQKIPALVLQKSKSPNSKSHVVEIYDTVCVLVTIRTSVHLPLVCPPSVSSPVSHTIIKWLFDRKSQLCFSRNWSGPTPSHLWWGSVTLCVYLSPSVPPYTYHLSLPTPLFPSVSPSLSHK